MKSSPIIVVGDRFTAFQRHMGITDFYKAVPALETQTTVALGQGLREDDMVRISQLASEHTGEITLNAVPHRVDQRATHKKVARNVAISEPIELATNVYSAMLLLDESSEILADHLTGQHIQGVALVEAARQLWTAVTELFLQPDAKPLRLVLERIAAQFKCYVFPLPTEMRLRIVENDASDVGLRLSFSVDFWQNGVICASVDADVRSVPQKIAEFQETMAARRAVDTFSLMTAAENDHAALTAS